MSNQRDRYGIRQRFVNDDFFPSTSCSDLANVHIGFLVNELKNEGGDIFSPTRRFSENEDASLGCCPNKICYYLFCMNIFSFIYTFIRNFVASCMMSDLDFRHCELAFDQDMFDKNELTPVMGIPYTQSCYVAYGTNLNEKVLMRKPRTFEPRRDKQSLQRSGIINPDKAYKWIHLRLPYDDVKDLIKFCEAEVGKKYDLRALERMPLFPKKLKPVDQWEKQHWHCTNFTVCMLQQIGLLNGLDPNALTADDVYIYLKNHKNERRTEITPARKIKEYYDAF